MENIEKTLDQFPLEGTKMTLADKIEDIDKNTLKEVAVTWAWHYGKVSGIGYFSTAGGREIVILWDEGGSSRKQGGISDMEWEVFKLAFNDTGRIAVLSDKPAPNWKFDYRFLEAKK